MTKLIKNTFTLLFFLLPLVFSFSTSELFEFPKIILLYFSTTLLVTIHLISFAFGNVPLFKKTSLTLPLILFLASQVISTIFSIDPHMSLNGYYSRFNGGLLSSLCYFLLYQVIVIYIDKDFIQKIIKTTLLSALFVSLYAVAQHFGIDKNVWVQDVQSRVFSSFGQPNWLAAYLAICISILLFQIDQRVSKIHFTDYLLLVTFYLSLLFTKSKSGLLATLPSLLFFSFKSLKNIKQKLLPFVAIILISTLVFDNPVKDKLLPKQDLKIDNSKIENLNITPSQDIRLIVWQGAIGLIKKFPLIGTGVETFGISYYWARPVTHNLTSEWDFLYNKAHNEYLNYAVTSGLVGFTTYLILLIVSLLKLRTQPFLFLAYLSILITNFAGFSVIATSLYLFILPALAERSNLPPATSKSKKLLLIPIILISLFCLLNVSAIYLSDLKYATSKKLSQTDLSSSLSTINTALVLRPKEPEYLIYQADILSQLALSQTSQDLANSSVQSLSTAEAISPFHLNYLKKSGQILFNLGQLNPDYIKVAINTIKKATVLAPTDAKSFYILGQFYQNDNQSDLAIEAFKIATQLKPNYDLAFFKLGQLYFTQKDFSASLDSFQTVLNLNPQAQEAQDYIDKISHSTSSPSTAL